MKKPGTKESHKGTNFQGIPLDSYIDRWMFLNATVGDFGAEFNTSQANSSPQSQYVNSNLLMSASSPKSFSSSSSSSSFSSSFIPPSIYHPFHSFSDLDSYLLDYFIRGISPSCSLSSSHNPYVSLVIPLCFSSVTLRHALLAVAANQLCLLGRVQFVTAACQYKHRALQGLRRDLSASVRDDGTVAAVLMLCFQDVRVQLSLPSPPFSPSIFIHLAFIHVRSSYIVFSDFQYRFRMVALFHG